MYICIYTYYVYTYKLKLITQLTEFMEKLSDQTCLHKKNLSFGEL